MLASILGLKNIILTAFSKIKIMSTSTILLYRFRQIKTSTTSHYIDGYV